jgi:hypothetical protein
MEHQEDYRQFEHFCLPKLLRCNQTESNFDCASAELACYMVSGPLGRAADFNVYDIRKPLDDEGPPSNYLKYLQNPHVLKAIGTRKSFAECSNEVMHRFLLTGDCEWATL